MGDLIKSYTQGQYRYDIYWDYDSVSFLDDEFASFALSVHPEEGRLPETKNEHYSDLISKLNDLDYCDSEPDIFQAWYKSWGEVLDEAKSMGHSGFEEFDIRQSVADVFNSEARPALVDLRHHLNLWSNDVDNELLRDEIVTMFQALHEVWVFENLSGYYSCGVSAFESEIDFDNLDIEILKGYIQAVVSAIDKELLIVDNLETSENNIVGCADSMVDMLLRLRNEQSDFPVNVIDLSGIAVKIWGSNPNIHEVALYEHGGICLQHGGGTCRWDSTPGAAWIICKPEFYSAWFEDLDMRVQGNYMGFVANWVCPEGHKPEDFGQTEEEFEVDSCWGLLENDPDKLFEELKNYCPQEDFPLIGDYSI